MAPRLPDDSHFDAQALIVLAPDPAVQVRVDLALKVEAIQSSSLGFSALEGRAGREQPIPEQSLDLVDWERAYLDLLAYKERKRFHNLVPRGAARRAASSSTRRPRAPGSTGWWPTKACSARPPSAERSVCRRP